MSILFISHSSRDRSETLALRAWLENQGWRDFFLDIDADKGIVVGERWLDALRKAGERCEAVLVLFSESWLESGYCMAEYLLARFTNKRIFGALLTPGLQSRLSGVITSDTQMCTLVGSGPTESICYVDDGVEREVQFQADGLKRLQDGLDRAGICGRSFKWPPEGVAERLPYRGLESLDRHDAAIFFGRDSEIAQCLELLRGMRRTPDERLLVLVAGSGSGKSSFLRAGLLPRLEREAHAFIALDVIRPMTAPITGEQGLATSLATAHRRLGAGHIEAGEVKTRLMNGSAALADFVGPIQESALRSQLSDFADPQAPTVVLTIDQAEELFSPAVSQDEPSRLLEALATAVKQGLQAGAAGSAPIIIFAVRADQFERLRTAGPLQGVKMRIFGLRPMDRGQFKDVIEGPARVATAACHPLKLEPALVQALLDDAAKAVDPLPLLAVTLARLVNDFGAGGNLRLAHYTELGGLKAVIANEVEMALATVGATREKKLAALRDAFIPWLVIVEPGTGQQSRRVAEPNELPLTSQDVVNALVERKLLVTDEHDGRATVEVAHEALLGQWDPLVGWIDEVRAELALQRSAEREAHAWHAAGRPAHTLWLHERQAPLYAALARLRVARERIEEPLRSFIRPEADRLLEEIHQLVTAHARRAAIGDRLSVIGDPRPGVGLCPDGLPDIAWCAIPAFTAPPNPDVQQVRRGRSSEEVAAPGKVETEGCRTPFFIARYPVTRLQYDVYVAFVLEAQLRANKTAVATRPEGMTPSQYAEHFTRFVEEFFAQHLVDPAGIALPEGANPIAYAEYHAMIKAVLERADKFVAEAPPEGVSSSQYAKYLALWDVNAERVLKTPRVPPDQGNRPMEGVSFEDAMGFCAWLSQRLQIEIALPTMEQRLWAARSATPGQPFPWGPQWDPSACNTRASGLGHATAVGLYPTGASQQQVFDLVGNVWEWTCTTASCPDRRLLAGGSWYGNGGGVTEADRSYRGANVGFRLICIRQGES